MGCFDSIMFRCTDCGTLIEEQSKAGDCSLKQFSSQSVPMEIAADVDGTMVSCHNCGKRFRAIALSSKRISMALVGLEMDV